jgi:glycosyltransferase involved in cell wall biosynthesis
VSPANLDAGPERRRPVGRLFVEHACKVFIAAPMKPTSHKPSMAFVDHSFHRKTRCADFLRDILKPYVRITDYWDETWRKGEPIHLEELKPYDYVFYFQVLHEPRQLQAIRGQIIWAPMYDGAAGLVGCYWKALANAGLKVIAFSEKIKLLCDQNKIPSISVKYYPDPDRYDSTPRLGGCHVFFWARGGIRFSDVQPLLLAEQIDSFTCLSQPDPGRPAEQVSPADAERLKVRLIRTGGFLPKQEYLRLLEQANVFIAPRRREGIGMSFLEALAMRKCVVAYDDATMNEYINTGKTGFLFRKDTSCPLDMSQAGVLAEHSYASVRTGYQDWLGEVPALQEFVLAENPRRFSGAQKLRASAYQQMSLTYAGLRSVARAAVKIAGWQP